MLTAVMLNWKRPENVRQALEGWRKSQLVKEAIVWDNNPDGERFRHDWASVINSSKDLGLYTRFAATLLASHECVLIQDDDLLLPESSLASLYQRWLSAPQLLHGLFGRRPTAAGMYDPSNISSGEVQVVLTRCLLANRRYAAEFFREAPRFSELQKSSKPFGNGEDIIFSYVAMRHSGQLNRVWRLPVRELPAPHSIHKRDWSDHLSHRTRIVRACQAWLTSESLANGASDDQTVNS